MDRVYQRCIELNPNIISLLVAVHSITPRRLEYMKEAGYELQKLHICKVFKWYGMSAMVIFQKTTEPSILTFDRNVWR